MQRLLMQWHDTLHSYKMIDLPDINEKLKRNVMLNDVHCAFCSDVHPRTCLSAIIFELMLLLKPTFVKLLMIYAD